MILVILNTFPSFLSSQMFGKNVVFLDFIPIIPASFRHSGVIPKFHFNWNDAGMTNDFGLKLTTFPRLRVVLALELSTYFTIFSVRALQVWVTLCSSWNLHTDCKESIGRFICPSVAGGMSWPLLQISITWFPYFFAGLHVSWAPYT